MTTKEAIDLIDNWLDENNDSKRYNAINQVDKIVSKYFLRPIDPLKNIYDYVLLIFKSTEDLQNIKKIILQQLELLKKICVLDNIYIYIYIYNLIVLK
ncbi:hypothetical protein [Candidatus Phytoplasma mali]|uniref:hypothetical protein n=1 Tax=Apple proliferation phytoplasma TaxID=37692 RepID=UPI0002DD3DC0|nr:hypothetical protein [Candidatus Phytoplasma mali]